MFGVAGKRPTSPDGKRMNPIVAQGIQLMSIGFLVDDDQPMIWRGPMVTKALGQLLNETVWDDVEYLVVDLRSEEHTSELQSLMRISYAVFCLKKKKQINREGMN